MAMVPTPRNSPPHDGRMGDERMNAAGSSSQKTEAAPPPKPEVRQAVKELLMRSPSFARLPAATQQQIAHDTAQVANYLAVPDGLPGNHLPTAPSLASAQADASDPSQSTYSRDVKQV